MNLDNPNMPALLDMNTSPAESEQAERKPTMRFQYPSGARPLEGYTIKRGVGRGGFGEVYFAVSDAGKEVALKLIRRNLEVELRGVTHCLNLKHTNLIDVYDIRTDEHDDRWVIMEFVGGPSLEDMIGRYPEGMPREIALHWFEGICAGVAYLHDHGIVHRDLKPANIFIDDGRIKIGDYGLSKFISCSRRSGQTESVGTVHYMAPEIANGRYGREIDAYALGIILYEMLTGRVPFEGESVGEVLMKHLTAEPDLSRLEEPFRSIVRGAMAKDPERRINSASEMAAMLRGAPRTPMHETAPFAGSSAPAQEFRPNAGGDDRVPYNGPAPMPSPGSTAAPIVTVNGESLRGFFHRDPDPVWAGVVRGWQRFFADLGYDRWPPFRRFAFRIAIAAAVCIFAKVTFPLAFLFLAWFLGYRFVRLVVQVVTHPPTSAPRRATQTPAATASAAASPSPWEPETTPSEANRVEVASLGAAQARPTGDRKWRRRRGQATWRFAAYQELASQPPRSRASTMLASLLAAAAIAPIAALLSCMFTVREFNLELFLWASIVGTLASWAIMIPAQLTEGRVEDQAPLRFTMLLVGALVGILAWAVAQMMYVNLPVSHEIGIRPKEAMSGVFLGWRGSELDAGFNSGAINLPLPMYTAYFAFLFVAIRWWRQGEWTRASRVSLWATAWAGAVGFFVSFLWWFPQPLGILAAAVISFTVQLASPWLTPSRRKQLAQAAVAAPVA
jgi:hypothetical protein